MPLPAFLPTRPAVPPGRITVLSKPSYAHVCIDDSKCGTTPADFVVAGNVLHNITVTRSGYLDWSDTVYLTAGETNLVNASLQPDTGINGIQVFVNPGGGTVCLDERQCHAGVGTDGGNSSTQFTGLVEGYHVITVNNTAGYQPFSIRPYVPRRGFASITINLDPVVIPGASPTTTPEGFATIPVTRASVTPVPVLVHGRLRVYVSPIGSTVCIDNVDCRSNVGGTPGPGTGFEDFVGVSANTPHTISVSADGYLPATSPVTVSPDKASSLTFVLQPAPVTTATPAPLPPPVPSPTKAGFDALVPAALALSCAVILLRQGSS
jgi:hypothetical protein